MNDKGSHGGAAHNLRAGEVETGRAGAPSLACLVLESYRLDRGPVSINKLKVSEE